MRQNPGSTIGKENFCEKLKEAFLEFYKPLTVINAFRTSGIYPVDSSAISGSDLKPSLTFNPSSTQSLESEHAHEEDKQETATEGKTESSAAQLGLEALESVLSTPVRYKYKARIEEGYDLEGVSPCFDAYRKLHKKAATSTQTSSNLSGLSILAEAALSREINAIESPNPGTSHTQIESKTISPFVSETLVLPKPLASKKKHRQTLLNTLPDNLTSVESIRRMSLKQLEKVKAFAKKEKRKKQSYVKKRNSTVVNDQMSVSQHADKPENNRPQKTYVKRMKKHFAVAKPTLATHTKTICCKGCSMTWEEDSNTASGSVWVECDGCNSWMHVNCVSQPVVMDAPFFCPDCQSKEN